MNQIIKHIQKDINKYKEMLAYESALTIITFMCLIMLYITTLFIPKLIFISLAAISLGMLLGLKIRRINKVII